MKDEIGTLQSPNIRPVMKKRKLFQPLPRNLSTYTVDELRDICRQKKVKITGKDRKDSIVRKIEAHEGMKIRLR